MLNNGLKYSDSRMAYEHEFIDNLASFDLKASHGSYVGGPVLFRKIISALLMEAMCMILSLETQDQ